MQESLIISRNEKMRRKIGLRKIRKKGHKKERLKSRAVTAQQKWKRAGRRQRKQDGKK